MVETKDLSKNIIDLDKSLGEKKKFWVLGIVTSPYLDNNVDMNRLSFSIPENADDGLCPIVTMNKIVTLAVYLIEQYLSDYLKPIAEEKRKRIENYIAVEAPQYRHLLKYRSDSLNAIKPGVTDDALDATLYKMDRDFSLATKKEGQQLVKELKNDVTQSADYKKRIEEHVARISDENKSIFSKICSSQEIYYRFV